MVSPANNPTTAPPTAHNHDPEPSDSPSVVSTSSFFSVLISCDSFLTSSFKLVLDKFGSFDGSNGANVPLFLWILDGTISSSFSGIGPSSVSSSSSSTSCLRFSSLHLLWFISFYYLAILCSQNLQAEMNWWEKVLGVPKFVVAPMVDGSELPFRLLCREYGALLTYTPMIGAKQFSNSKKLQKKMLKTLSPLDRPIIAQFCSNNPQELLIAAKSIEHAVDAIDINFGCPQRVAKTGNYGAFLLENDWEIAQSLVETLHKNLKIPVTCKIRILPSREKTIELVKMLEASGCQLLAVHARTRHMKGVNLCDADWSIIRDIKSVVSIPVIANGNIYTFKDVETCMKETKADGVMSAWSILRNPAIFSGKEVNRIDLARRYAEIWKENNGRIKDLFSHISYMLEDDLKIHRDCKLKLFSEKKGELSIINSVLEELQRRKNGESPNIFEEVAAKKRKRTREQDIDPAIQKKEKNGDDSSL